MSKCIFLIGLLFLLPSFVFAQQHNLTFTPHWLPQAQFAGYYMAEKKGFYEAENLHVTITHPSASVMATDKLQTGESDIISLFLVSAVTAQDNGIDMVNICQLSQQSALLFITKKTSNIHDISDLDGKKIGIWESGFDEVPKTAIRKNNCNVEWVPILSTPNLFLVDGIDAMTVMWYNEYDQIINSGINEDELNPIFLSDYGFNIPEDGIYCLRSTYNNRKEDLEKFVAATIKGWQYAEQNREETLEYVLKIMKAAHVPTNRAHQSWMLDKILELQQPGEKKNEFGELAEDDFIKTQNLLLEGKYIKNKIPFDHFYKPLN